MILQELHMTTKYYLIIDMYDASIGIYSILFHNLFGIIISFRCVWIHVTFKFFVLTATRQLGRRVQVVKVVIAWDVGQFEPTILGQRS